MQSIDYTEDETINKFIRGLLRGRIQPNQVPKQYMTKINTALDIEKTSAINEGSIAKVKQIHKIKSDLIRAEQIRNAVSSHSCLPLLHRRSSYIPPYSNEDVESTLQDLADGQPLDHSKTNMIIDLIHLTKEKINNLIENQQFTEAQSYENILQQLFIINNEVSIEKKHNSRKENYEKLLREAKESLEEAKSEYEQLLNDFDQDADDSRQDLLDRQQQQLDDFDDETMKGPSPQYFKMSKQYLTLRGKQKALISNKQYEEAAILKVQADELEETEKQKLLEKFYNERLVIRANMYNDFTNKQAIFDEQINAKRYKLILERNDYIQSKQRSIENIQKKFINAKKLLKNDRLNSTINRSSLQSRKSDSKMAQRSRTNSSMTSTMPQLRSDNNKPSKVSISTQTNKRFNFTTVKYIESSEI